MLRLLLLIVSSWGLFATERATAQVFTPSLSLFYFTTASKRDFPGTADLKDTVKTKDTYTFINLGACYNLNGICLGLKYLQGELETRVTSPSGGGLTKSVFHGPGVTVGYSGAEGIVAHVSLLLGAKKDIESTSTTYFCKSATILELGYGFTVGSVRIGPLLGIYEFVYNKANIDGVSSSLKPEQGDDFIMPQVALWVDL